MKYRYKYSNGIIKDYTKLISNKTIKNKGGN